MTGTGDTNWDDVLDQARRWVDSDPDPLTRAAVTERLDSRDFQSIAVMFAGRLAFGTAGLRGPLGPGPMAMNRLVVQQSTAGLARRLLWSDINADGGVVIGHDARHRSAQFCDDVSEILAAHGIRVHRFRGPCPTPLVAFALRHLEAAAAVVITASHNPAQDNGMKVYWSDGAQIVTPIDLEIAELINDVARDGALASTTTSIGEVMELGSASEDSPVVRAYLDYASTVVAAHPQRVVPLAVTSMHGVGADLLRRTLTYFGHGPLHEVRTQRDPDPDFPTVEFPNPEEPGAMDAVIALAEDVGAHLALANDPDADRVAVAARTPGGAWRSLTGDEVGALFASHLLLLTAGAADRFLATTVVSSRLVSAMAAAAGVHFAETLTGFKWLCRPALAHPEWTQVMLYEEALGYAIGPRSRDKDGIVGALLAAEIARDLDAQGRTVWDVLDELAVRHGAHETANGAVRFVGTDARADLRRTATRIADSPPLQIGGIDVARIDRPADDVLRLWLTDNTRVVLRPSGTEAKFKYYCEAIEPVQTSGADTPSAARHRARKKLAVVVQDLTSRTLRSVAT